MACIALEGVYIPDSCHTVGQTIFRSAKVTNHFIAFSAAAISSNPSLSWDPNWNNMYTGNFVYDYTQAVPFTYEEIFDGNGLIGYQLTVDDMNNPPMIWDMFADIEIYSMYNGYPVLNIASEVFQMATLNSLTIKHDPASTPPVGYKLNISRAAFSLMTAEFIDIQVDITLIDNRIIAGDYNDGTSVSLFASAFVGTIILPESLETITYQMFQMCMANDYMSHTKIMISGQKANYDGINRLPYVTKISANAFDNAYIENVHIPATVVEMGANVFVGWSSSQTVHIELTQAEIDTLVNSGNWATNWIGGSPTIEVLSQSYSVTFSANPYVAFSTNAAMPVSHGANFTFTVTVNAAYTQNAHMAEIRVNGQLLGYGAGIYTVPNVTEDITVTMPTVLNKNIYTVTLTSTDYVKFSTDIAQVTHGDNFVFSVGAQTPYTQNQQSIMVLQNGSYFASGGGTHTINNVTGNVELTSPTPLALNKYIVTFTSTQYVTFSQTTVTVNHGDSLTFSIAANTPYTQNAGSIQTYVNGSLAKTGAGSHTVNITGNTTVTSPSTLDLNKYTVTLISKEYVVYSPASATVTHGQSFSFTITVPAMYSQRAHLLQTKVNGDDVKTGTGSYTISSVTSHTTVEAPVAIDKNEYTLIFNYENGSEFTKIAATHGETIAVPATPEIGGFFSKWSGGLGSTFIATAAATFTAEKNGEKTLDQCLKNGVYEIWTINQFNGLRYQPDGGTGRVYKFMNSFDYKGGIWVPLSYWNGILDGNGHSFTGFIIDTTGSDRNFGFIRNNGGTIRNLSLGGTLILNQSAQIPDRMENVQAGLFVGINFATVSNCTAISGSFVSVNYYHIAKVGGLVGTNQWGAQINNCINSANVFGSGYTGGIAGVSGGIISSCTQTGSELKYSYNVENRSLGGITGYMFYSDSNNKLINCQVINTTLSVDTSSFSSESRTFQPRIGILVGEMVDGSITNCTWTNVNVSAWNNLKTVTWTTGIWPFNTTHTHDQRLYVKTNAAVGKG